MGATSFAIFVLMVQVGAGFPSQHDNVAGAFGNLDTVPIRPRRALTIISFTSGGDSGGSSGSGASSGSPPQRSSGGGGLFGGLFTSGSSEGSKSTNSGGNGGGSGGWVLPGSQGGAPAKQSTPLNPQPTVDPVKMFMTPQNTGQSFGSEDPQLKQKANIVGSGGNPAGDSGSNNDGQQSQGPGAHGGFGGGVINGIGAAIGAALQDGAGNGGQPANNGGGGGSGSVGGSSGGGSAPVASRSSGQAAVPSNGGQVLSASTQAHAQIPPAVPSSSSGGTGIRHPYIVSLRKDGQGHYCTGVLVSSQVVATAAQCVDTGASSSAVDRPTLYIGGLPREQPVEVRQTAGVTPHPSWRRDKNGGYDVALIRMDSPVGLEPMKYPKQGTGLGDNEQLKLLGWGRTTENGPFAEVLQQIPMPYLNRDTCAQTSPFASNSIFLCAGGQGSNICNGDEGAPLFRDGGSASNDFLLGIASFRDATCDDRGIPGIFTRVDQIGQWISENAA